MGDRARKSPGDRKAPGFFVAGPGRCNLCAAATNHHTPGGEMIVDHRTYAVKPGKLNEYLKLYETEAYPLQLKYLGHNVGWYTSNDIGPAVAGGPPVGLCEPRRPRGTSQSPRRRSGLGRLHREGDAVARQHGEQDPPAHVVLHDAGTQGMIDELAAADSRRRDGRDPAGCGRRLDGGHARARARGARNLHLVCVPISGLQADVLIGAGCVRSIETSAVTLGEFGTAPRFAAALKAGSIRVLDATCPAIHAALQAGQKGIPFIPLRGLIGTDLVRHRPDWKVIDNPFGTDDPIVLLPAIRPDVALFHAPLADAQGNVYIGRQRDLLTMAQAAKQTFVTVEAITDDDLMRDERGSRA